MPKQVNLGRVVGKQGAPGFSPKVSMSKQEKSLTIFIEDEEGVKSETIDTSEPVQSDWNVTDPESLAYIKNKPNIGGDSDGNNIRTNYAAALQLDGSSIKLVSKSGAILSSIDLPNMGGIAYQTSEPTSLSLGMVWIG